MPTRPNKKRRNQLDPLELARKIVDQAVGDTPKACWDYRIFATPRIKAPGKKVRSLNRNCVPNAINGYPGKPPNGGSNARFYDFDDGVTRLVKWHPSRTAQRRATTNLSLPGSMTIMDIVEMLPMPVAKKRAGGEPLLPQAALTPALSRREREIGV
jgi:hypothetical protein